MPAIFAMKRLQSMLWHSGNLANLPHMRFCAACAAASSQFMSMYLVLSNVCTAKHDSILGARSIMGCILVKVCSSRRCFVLVLLT